MALPRAPCHTRPQGNAETWKCLSIEILIESNALKEWIEIARDILILVYMLFILFTALMSVYARDISMTVGLKKWAVNNYQYLNGHITKILHINLLYKQYPHRCAINHHFSHTKSNINLTPNYTLILHNFTALLAAFICHNSRSRANSTQHFKSRPNYLIPGTLPAVSARPNHLSPPGRFFYR